MEVGTDMKALYIVANAGHIDEIMEILRAAGAPGGTVVHARGEGSKHQLFMGITLDYEREVIITIIDKDSADKIMADIKEKAGWETDVRGICYTMPVEKIIGLRKPE
jgi:nitrogen regulatory protein PII